MHLYKYFNAEGALRLLRTGMLRFTQAIEFNDPFEMQPFLKGLADESTLEGQFGSGFGTSLDPQIDQMLSLLSPEQKAVINRDTIKQLVQAQAPAGLERFKNLAATFTPFISGEIYKKINESLGVLCLTEKPTNLLMWAHYGDHHRGAVVEFDTLHPFFNRRRGPQDDFRHFRKVTYTDERPALFLDNSDAVNFFYFKSREWEYEQEWRLIVPLTDCTLRLEQAPNSAICLFEVPAECVRAVSLGVRTPKEKKLELSIELRSRNSLRHVRVEQIDLDAQIFTLNRREIDPTKLDAWVSSKNQKDF